MKKTLLVLLVLASVFILAGCSEDKYEIFIRADYPYYNSIEELSDNSTNVIRARVVSNYAQRLDTALRPRNAREDTGAPHAPFYQNHIVTQIEVLEVFRGYLSVGDVVEMRQLGGTVGNRSYINPDLLNISVNDELVLFLFSFSDSVLPYILPNPVQSAYRFSDNAASARGRNNNVTLPSVNSDNSLSLSINDLEALTRIN